MVHGRVLGVGGEFPEYKWYQDALPEAYNDDALWAYMIRLADQMNWKFDFRKDKVMERLLLMGLYDWDEHLESVRTPLQAMRHATAMVSRLWPRITSLEDKVTLPIAIKQF